MLLRTQLLGCEGERSGLNHWTEMTEGTCNVLRTFREVDVSPVSPNSTSQAERQNTKEQHTSLRLVCWFFVFCLSACEVELDLAFIISEVELGLTGLTSTS